MRVTTRSLSIWLRAPAATLAPGSLRAWRLARGAVVALFTFSGVTAFSVLVVIVALLLSWEWGRLVHGREADVVIAIHVGSAGAAAVLAAFGYVGLGLLSLPIGAVLGMLLSLG